MAGRPPKEFSREVFEGLCSIMCTEEEICRVLRTTDKTLNNWCKRTYKVDFSEAYKRFSCQGKMTLRRYQFKLAQKSPAMAIFLGKNYLGQRDNLEHEDNAALDKLDEILRETRDNAIKQETE